jgi:hypothetical protein
VLRRKIALMWVVLRLIQLEGRSQVRSVAKFSSTGCVPMKTFVLLLLIPLAVALDAPRTLAQSCTAATCYATTPSEADFLAALPSSSNTNATVVVNIPSGISAWTTGLSYTIPSAVTSLTIQGATTVTCTGTAGTSSFACTAADSSIIQDSYASNNVLISFTTSGANQFFRITGLTFEGGNIGSSSNNKYNGAINISGSSQNVRIDHCHINSGTYSPTTSSTWARLFNPSGVFDHNVQDLGATSQTNDTNGIQFYNAIDDTIGNGDGGWASASNWGSSAFWFMESNQLNGGYPNDCANAGRFVMRYNSFNGATVAVQTHGTKTPAGSQRGCREYEFYKNYITNSTSSLDAATGSKGGSALIWGNTLSAGYYHFWAGATDRQSGDEPETNTPNGWGYCGTTVSGNGVGSAWDGNQPASLGYPCLDGLGRGQTAQALNGANFPARRNSATGTISWPQQYLEPIYLWNNSILNGAAEVSIRDTITTVNRDMYTDNPVFIGATGTGYGLLSARPAVCVPGLGGPYYASPTGSYGVAYWATDANGGQGELYVCTSLNTWTGTYEPYTYPHPLVAGSGSSGNPPNAPQNLTATVQ